MMTKLVLFALALPLACLLATSLAAKNGKERLTKKALAERLETLEQKEIERFRTGDEVVLENGHVLLFRATAGVPGVLDTFSGRAAPASRLTMPCGCTDVKGNCDGHYRSQLLDKWDKIKSGIDKIRVGLYVDGKEVKYIEFLGPFSGDFKSWFSKSTIQSSSWADLNQLSANQNFQYFSVDGHRTDKVYRTFFVEKSYGGCPNDYGWLAVVEKEDVCVWGKQLSKYPALLFANDNGVINWETGKKAEADVMIISAKFKEAETCDKL